MEEDLARGGQGGHYRRLLASLEVHGVGRLTNEGEGEKEEGGDEKEEGGEEKAEVEKEEEEAAAAPPREAAPTLGPVGVTPVQAPRAAAKGGSGGQLVEVEARHQGAVPLSTYFAYFQAFGNGCFVACLLAMYPLAEACAAIGEWWLGQW
jgi:hypothetical protein